MFDRIALAEQAMADAPEIVRPSKFWQGLNAAAVDQLRHYGYENFKQTLATNYFTWTALNSSQMDFLRARLPRSIFERSSQLARQTPCHPCFSEEQSIAYNLLTYLVYAYAIRSPIGPRLARLEEPLEGNPPRVMLDGRLISQDLANSALEFHAIKYVLPGSLGRIVMELGSGYGRDAYVFLKNVSGLRYILVDIPPALCVAERYLSNQFPTKRIFRFRPFERYEQVREEFEQAEIAFLLPHQIDRLPDKAVDVFINISSLHEMLPRQIEHYLAAADRLVRGYVYLKEWKVSRNEHDNLIVTEHDYPIRKNWPIVYWRECRVQTEFFEAMMCVR